MHQRSSLWAVTAVLVFLPCISSEYVDKFQVCRNKTLGILAGNETLGDINNVTIWERGYMYTGPVQGLDPRFSREHILTLTYDGCVAICGPDAQLQEPRTALSMVATWIFPLAIVLSLPYEAYHDKKFMRTLSAILNWLGSPQTALTATIHNFRQIREAHRRTERLGEEDYHSAWNNALYVLSCLNQFEIVDPEDEGRHMPFLETLLYGLFRPVAHRNYDGHEDGELTSQLLSQLAYQLRILATFLVAFVFSVVLSFAEVGESSTVDPLILGLLFSWLPVLVIFTIVDRNPVSSERTGVLMTRWLYNVNAIKSWREHDVAVQNAAAVENARAGPNIFDEADFIGRFIGQGRATQYAGLSYAVMKEIPPRSRPLRTFPGDYVTFAERAPGRRPPSWFVTALLSEGVVMAEVMLALMLAFNTPTVGLGCWSGSFALYAILSSMCWILALCFAKPGRVVTCLCYVFNALSFAWLIIVTVLVLTGGMNTCYCQVSPFAYPAFGGYMTFENTQALRDLFDVVKYWAAAAGFGLAIPMVVFVVAVFWWLKCAHLWKANEDRDMGNELGDSRVDWRWLT
ncbi:hypothetical protein CONLIGDRAFT_694582 [Coniochaeta ligniaria NRRL 30616]|uniref:DUF3533 domain-containing protein n=1 Tax=Coniochaeta ligniaria NRRL 30616 TaxID=1408157 RepID=A0A1J7I5N0_9PEZI|nr:hypothetical protein CONLIGDRAFT_694582 [Coniochaeta ligniaria NRRL 30616]